MEQYIFLKTERKTIIDEKVALFGVLGCDIYESKGTTANNVNMVLLIAKMCFSNVKYGIARSPIFVFETEMAVREKISQLINRPLYFSICYVLFYYPYFINQA